jgi:hypothetical protein
MRRHRAGVTSFLHLEQRKQPARIALRGSMKMKWVTMLALGAALATTAAVKTAQAGLKILLPISIDLTNRSAQGALGDVRASGDGQQYIVCAVTAWSVGSPSAQCWGRDNSTPQKAFSCSTTNASLISTVQGLNGDSYLTVFWDTQGNCTEISIENASWATPKSQ